LPRPNWSRPLPRPLCIIDKGKEFLRLATLADVRELMHHLPAERRKLNTWRHVAKQLAAAADGGDINEAVIALRLVLRLEQVPCLPR
jgi:hypothetical protein